MRILNPIELEFNSKHSANEYGTWIDNVGVVPICVSDRLKSEGFCKERRYISWKNRYVDIRLSIDRETFLAASPEQRIMMSLQNIKDSILAIESRTQGKLDTKALLDDILGIAKRIFYSILI